MKSKAAFYCLTESVLMKTCFYCCCFCHCCYLCYSCYCCCCVIVIVMLLLLFLLLFLLLLPLILSVLKLKVATTIIYILSQLKRKKRKIDIKIPRTSFGAHKWCNCRHCNVAASIPCSIIGNWNNIFKYIYINIYFSIFQCLFFARC